MKASAKCRTRRHGEREEQRGTGDALNRLKPSGVCVCVCVCVRVCVCVCAVAGTVLALSAVPIMEKKKRKIRDLNYPVRARERGGVMKQIQGQQRTAVSTEVYTCGRWCVDE